MPKYDMLQKPDLLVAEDSSFDERPERCVEVIVRMQHERSPGEVGRPFTITPRLQKFVKYIWGQQTNYQKQGRVADRLREEVAPDIILKAFN